MSIRSHIISFLSNASIRSLEDAKQAILPLRNISIPSFTQQQSRQLWYALLLYKFREEQSVPEILWATSRQFIIMSMKEEPLHEIASRYFLLFETWKEKDYQSFIQEVAQFYFQLIELKDSIERIQDEDSLAIWRPLYVGLITRVRDAAKKLGFLEALEHRISEYKQQKEHLVYSILHKAYWDMFEEELKRDYFILLCTLNELRQIMEDIAPSSMKHLVDDMNLEYITHQIRNDEFGKKEAWELWSWCMNVLKQWDTVENEIIYEREWEKMLASELEWPTLLRNMIEITFVLAVQLKTRKGLWLSLFRQLE
jgi:hypothetical protein